MGELKLQTDRFGRFKADIFFLSPSCLVDSEHSSQSMFVNGNLSSSQFVMTALLFNPGPDEQVHPEQVQLQ